MIEKISSILAEKLLQATNDSDQNNFEILKYGIECIINTLIPVTFFVIYSLFQRIFPEMLCWFTVFLIMRNAFGGYHAASHEQCIFLSTIYGLFSLILLQHMYQMSLYIKLIVSAVILIIHILLPPVISQEEIKTKKHLKLLKTKIISIIIFTALLSILFHTHISSFSNAIILGTINAELLFLIEKFRTIKLHVS